MEENRKPTKNDLVVLRQEALMEVYNNLDEDSRMFIDYQADRLIKGIEQIGKQRGRTPLKKIGKAGALEILCCLGAWLGKEGI